MVLFICNSYSWKRPSAAEAIQLLDYRFQDARIRAYAVTIIAGVSDAQLVNILYQLVYLLRFEPYSDSSLVRFLYRRSVNSPSVLGRKLALYIQAIFVQDPAKNRSYGLLLSLLFRSFPDKERVHISHGWHFLRKLDDTFREAQAEYLIADAAVHSAASQNSLFSRKKTPDKSKLPKSAVDSMIERLISAKIPSEFYTSVSAKLCTSVDKYVALTDEGRKKTFAVSFSVDKASVRTDRLRIVYRFYVFYTS